MKKKENYTAVYWLFGIIFAYMIIGVTTIVVLPVFLILRVIYKELQQKQTEKNIESRRIVNGRVVKKLPKSIDVYETSEPIRLESHRETMRWFEWLASQLEFCTFVNSASDPMQDSQGYWFVKIRFFNGKTYDQYLIDESPVDVALYANYKGASNCKKGRLT